MDGHQLSLAPSGGATGDRPPGAGRRPITPDQYGSTAPTLDGNTRTRSSQYGRTRTLPKFAEREPHMTNVTVIRLCSLQASLKTVKIH